MAYGLLIVPLFWSLSCNDIYPYNPISEKTNTADTRPDPDLPLKDAALDLPAKDVARKTELKNEYHCLDSYEKQTYEWSEDTLSLFCEKPAASEVRRPDGTVERKAPIDEATEAGLCHYYGGGIWELKKSEKESFRFRIEGESAEVGSDLSFRWPAPIGEDSSSTRTNPTTFKRSFRTFSSIRWRPGPMSTVSPTRGPQFLAKPGDRADSVNKRTNENSLGYY